MLPTCPHCACNCTVRTACGSAFGSGGNSFSGFDCTADGMRCGGAGLHSFGKTAFLIFWHLYLVLSPRGWRQLFDNGLVEGDRTVRGHIGRFVNSIHSVLLIPCCTIHGMNGGVLAFRGNILVCVVHTKGDTFGMFCSYFCTGDAAAPISTFWKVGTFSAPDSSAAYPM